MRDDGFTANYVLCTMNFPPPRPSLLRAPCFGGVQAWPTFLRPFGRKQLRGFGKRAKLWTAVIYFITAFPVRRSGISSGRPRFLPGNLIVHRSSFIPSLVLAATAKRQHAKSDFRALTSGPMAINCMLGHEEESIWSACRHIEAMLGIARIYRRAIRAGSLLARTGPSARIQLIPSPIDGSPLPIAWPVSFGGIRPQTLFASRRRIATSFHGRSA